MPIKISPAFDVVIQILNQTIVIVFSRPPGSEILADINQLKNQPGIIFSDTPKLMFPLIGTMFAELTLEPEQISQGMVMSMLFLPNYDVWDVAKSLAEYFEEDHEFKVMVSKLEEEEPPEEMGEVIPRS